MPATSIAYPPTATHTNHDESLPQTAITNAQPSTGAKMVVASDDNAAQSRKAERLRGGCIPCPLTRRVCYRTEVYVGSSHVAVASKKLRAGIDR
ncbi:hypothetical protein EI94DRAFT_1715284 [Lactarius quietus]|nr:hypothetical protein EI94DRAFT_1715284 [Lactarius quietus]